MTFRLRQWMLLSLFTLVSCQQPVTHSLFKTQAVIVNDKKQAVSNARLEISKSALEHNLNTLQSMLNEETLLCAVLKGDAYGHDLSLVAPVLIENGVKCIGVASNRELQTVRQLGFNGRLMRVRIPTEQEMYQALDFDVEELIGNIETAKQLNTLAGQRSKTVPIHLALNSAGMSRNGLEMTTLAGLDEARAISELPNLKIVGIMSHFPEEEVDAVRRELVLFKQQAQQVLQVTGLSREEVTLHVANTFATLAVPESHLDMVRVGGIFYGDTIVNPQQYQRAMTFKSTIAALHRYPRGNTVGYDRTKTLTRNSILANIPLGYADGYRRVFSNVGYVLINGQRAPVMGKTSMNTVMVDVTNVKNVKPGDEVVLFGKQGSSEITADQIEEISGALFTEMSILWGATNPRILVE